jgi:hypothetical protein
VTFAKRIPPSSLSSALALSVNDSEAAFWCWATFGSPLPDVATIGSGGGCINGREYSVSKHVPPLQSHAERGFGLTARAKQKLILTGFDLYCTTQHSGPLTSVREISGRLDLVILVANTCTSVAG